MLTNIKLRQSSQFNHTSKYQGYMYSDGLLGNYFFVFVCFWTVSNYYV